jgi:arabinofuranosyltransferase
MPNTAYAKVFAGLPLMEVWERGWSYLGLSLELDPVLALVLVLGLGGAALRRRRRERAIALGIVLHLLYVVHVGGDFMAGRFLLAPGVAAHGVVARWRLRRGG